jgi:hypothetical protein
MVFRSLEISRSIAGDRVTSNKDISNSLYDLSLLAPRPAKGPAAGIRGVFERI